MSISERIEKQVNYPKTKVKCPMCGEKFDRNEVEFVTKNSRYYHAACYDSEDMQKADREAESYKELISYICRLRGESRPSMLVLSQIKRYKEHGYTYGGIKMSLEYFHVIKGNPVIKEKGIGIVESIYDVAKEYYKKRHELLLKNSEIEYKKEVRNYGKPSHMLRKKHEQKIIDLEEIKWT